VLKVRHTGQFSLSCRIKSRQDAFVRVRSLRNGTPPHDTPIALPAALISNILATSNSHRQLFIKLCARSRHSELSRHKHHTANNGRFEDTLRAHNVR